MKLKLTLLALSCALATHAFAEEDVKGTPANPAEAFQLPTQVINEAPIETTKQDIFDAAVQGISFTPSKSKAMGTINPNDEVERISRKMGSQLMNEEDFNEYQTQTVNSAVGTGQSYSFLDIVKSKYKPIQNLKDLKPGANVAIPVAVGLTNPIVTNFKMVAARTHDEESVIELEEGRVYITLNTLKPVALMLFEEGVPESMINLTLVPMEAMPVIVNASVELTQSMKYKGIEHRRDLKEQEAIANAVQSEDYTIAESDRISRIKDILKPIGRGEIPQGFTLSHDTSKALAKPCGMSISQSVEQRIVGPREVVDVVRVKNTTTRPYSVREQMCESRDVMAVAIYNKSLLQPNEATEIYILRNKLQNSPVNTNSKRPRVIN
tara:strand:- start:5384 stop:6523 length:1140 start_codon:yes stop_codon:yes gene_type:complete